MSKMSELHLTIAEQLEKGELTFFQIADRLQVPIDWVEEVANDLIKQYRIQLDLFDYDGDAFKSAGWGTDEDY